ncbi:uncharacterized protein [Triticum aestivum]|uniref:uncharacterized protein isoform X2 n=1 Tax=Triticum aestivum TaxID=4565 RepID=UPI001D01B83F|nr:uncharacterized protein LOC123081825 isoform X2 [Triticum aestivum]
MVPLCTGLFNNPCVAHVKPPPCQSPSHAAGAPGLSRTSSPIGTVPPPPSPRCTPLLLPLRPESVASSASMQENDGLAHAHLQRQQGCADPLSQGQAAGLPCACLPQISVEPAPFGPRAAGEHHQAQEVLRRRCCSPEHRCPKSAVALPSRAPPAPLPCLCSCAAACLRPHCSIPCFRDETMDARAVR